MTKQERAEKTRTALIRSAAFAFDRQGYAGASLGEISSAAGVTKGALSFHFSSKDELADAVQELAVERTGQVLDSVIRRPVPALQSVIDASHALTLLLNEEPAVRAGVRLSRERHHPTPQRDWYAAWLQPIRGLLLRARSDRSLRPGADVQALAVLVAYVVTGCELSSRRQLGLAEIVPFDGVPGRAGVSTAQWLERIWRMVLPEIVGESGTLYPGGTLR